MSVYVDDQRAPYRRMRMCHMIADSLVELHAMADRISVSRMWFQSKSKYPHYDICMAKRKLAVANGAIEITSRQAVKILNEKYLIVPNIKTHERSQF